MSFIISPPPGYLPHNPFYACVRFLVACDRIHSTSFPGIYCNRELNYDPVLGFRRNHITEVISQRSGWLPAGTAQLSCDQKAASEVTPPSEWVFPAWPVFSHFTSKCKSCSGITLKLADLKSYVCPQTAREAANKSVRGPYVWGFCCVFSVESRDSQERELSKCGEEVQKILGTHQRTEVYRNGLNYHVDHRPLQKERYGGH